MADKKYNPEIGFIYLSNLIDEKTIQELEKSLEKENITIKKKDISKQPQAFLDEISGVINFILDNPIISGLVSAAAYDAIKMAIKKIKQLIKDKKIAKVSASKIEEKKATLGVRARVNNTFINFKISGISEEFIDEALNSMFNFLQNYATDSQPRELIAKYDDKEHEWKIIDLRDQI